MYVVFSQTWLIFKYVCNIAYIDVFKAEKIMHVKKHKFNKQFSELSRYKYSNLIQILIVFFVKLYRAEACK